MEQLFSRLLNQLFPDLDKSKLLEKRDLKHKERVVVWEQANEALALEADWYGHLELVFFVGAFGTQCIRSNRLDKNEIVNFYIQALHLRKKKNQILAQNASAAGLAVLLKANGQESQSQYHTWVHGMLLRWLKGKPRLDWESIAKQPEDMSKWSPDLRELFLKDARFAPLVGFWSGPYQNGRQETLFVSLSLPSIRENPNLPVDASVEQWIAFCFRQSTCPRDEYSQVAFAMLERNRTLCTTAFLQQVLESTSGHVGNYAFYRNITDAIPELADALLQLLQGHSVSTHRGSAQWPMTELVTSWKSSELMPVPWLLHTLNHPPKHPLKRLAEALAQ